MSFSYSSLSSAPAAQTPVGSGQVLQGCAKLNLDRNRNMPDHELRPKASLQQEPRLPSQALTQGCISLLPYQLNNVKLHYLVVRNEALHSGEGVPGADCTAAMTIGSYKAQAGREIIMGSSSFSLGSHHQHTTAAVLRQSHPGRTLGLSRLRVWPGMYETDRRLDWEEFLQERATATLKRSITLLQLSSSAPLGVVRALAVVPATLPRRGSGGGSGSIRNRLSSSPTVLPTRSSRPQLIPDVLRTAMMCGRWKPRELLSQWFKTPVRFLPGVFSNSYRCSCPISVRTSSLLARASAS